MSPEDQSEELKEGQKDLSNAVFARGMAFGSPRSIPFRACETSRLLTDPLPEFLQGNLMRI